MKLPYKTIDMTQDEYRSYKEFLNHSALKEYIRSPADYLMYISKEREKSQQMQFGSAYHSYIESQIKHSNDSLFMSEYFIIDCNERPDKKHSMISKENKEWLNELEKIHINIIYKNDFKIISDMAKKILSDIYVSAILKNGNSEESTFCEYESLKFKYRCDFVNDIAIIDFKTTNDIEKFQYSIINYLYYFQVGMYVDLEEHVTGKRKTWYWIVQEKHEPYHFLIIKSSKKLVEYSSLIFFKVIQQHKICQKTKKYLGKEIFIEKGKKGQRIREITIQEWAMKDINFYN